MISEEELKRRLAGLFANHAGVDLPPLSEEMVLKLRTMLKEPFNFHAVRFLATGKVPHL